MIRRFYAHTAQQAIHRLTKKGLLERRAIEGRRYEYNITRAGIAELKQQQQQTRMAA